MYCAFHDFNTGSINIAFMHVCIYSSVFVSKSKFTYEVFVLYLVAQNMWKIWKQNKYYISKQCILFKTGLKINMFKYLPMLKQLNYSLGSYVAMKYY